MSSRYRLGRERREADNLDGLARAHLVDCVNRMADGQVATIG